MSPEQKREYYRQYYKAHKEQRNEYNRKWHQAHKEQHNEHKRKWYQAHKEQQNKNHHQWYEAHKEHEKEKEQKRYKKLGEKRDPKQFCKKWKLYFPDAFQKLLAIQENRCAVCGISLEHHQIHVDHDHVTSLVRGLLCWRCNRYRVAQNRADNIKQVNEYLLNPPAIQLE